MGSAGWLDTSSSYFPDEFNIDNPKYSQKFTGALLIIVSPVSRFQQ